MDATVDQSEGYRFVYLLPFGPKEIFVEDTYYSDTPDLDVADAQAAHRRLCRRSRLDRRRAPAGPKPASFRWSSAATSTAYWPAADAVARGGVRAGLFQPLTSYSLPDAVRFASWLAALPDLAGTSSRQGHAADYARRRWRRNAYYRMLGTDAVPRRRSAERYRILERFYRLSPALIGRFYAGRVDASGQNADPQRPAAGPARSRAQGAGGAQVKSAIVIGAGFGGLALAIRLQSAGRRDDHRRGARQARRPRLFLGTRRPYFRCRPDGHHRPRLPQETMGAVAARTSRPMSTSSRSRLSTGSTGPTACASIIRTTMPHSRPRSPRSTQPTSRVIASSSNIAKACGGGLSQARHQGVPSRSATC